jgi:diguanylate cyclase (GGDEF)-like protein
MADASDVGEGCVEQILKLLAGEEIESIVVPTRFIKRDSFARPNGFYGIEGLGADIKKMTEQYFDDIFYRYKCDDADGNLCKVNRAFYRFMEYMEGWSDNAAQRDLKEEDVEGYLEGFINYKVVKYADMENLLAVFEKIYEELMIRQTEETGRLRIGGLFAMLYERVAHIMNYHMGASIIEESAYNNSLKTFVRDMLQFERGTDQSYGSLLGKLDWLQVKNAYIFTYEEPVMNLEREMFSKPEYLYLKAMQQGAGVTVVSSVKQKVAFSDIFKPEVLGIEGACNLVVLPLFFNEMLYGVLVCDLTDGIFENGEFLCNQMSAAVKMIDLLKNNESIQQRLEESMATLRENNIVLDTLSKSDGLTGIRNRRGFEDAAERMCKFCKSDDKVVLTAYVDMNNLKIINDRYGHDEGDFSLKTIGDILVKVIGEEGVVGRIGGDEFACVLPVPKEQNAQELLDRIYAEFTAFNLESDKPYNITVSAGAYLLQPTDDLTLQQALSLADEQLYEVKKLRTREVAKTPVAVAL